MRSGIARFLAVAALGAWLAACSTAKDKLAQAADPDHPFKTAEATPAAGAAAGEAAPKADPVTTGTVGQTPGAPAAAGTGLLGSDPNDELSLGKKQYHANNFGLAEKHFRRAVELHPRDAEAWLGLAASYDRLRRFDLADRAYAEATKIVGPTVEILNNQGFSYMLRGNYARAREKLLAAERKDPGNKFVANNLRLLNKSWRKGKAIE